VFGGLLAGEERTPAQVPDRRVEGGEHQADDHVGAEGSVDALHGDGGLSQHAAHDEHHGSEQDQAFPEVRRACADCRAGQHGHGCCSGSGNRHGGGRPGLARLERLECKLTSKLRAVPFAVPLSEREVAVLRLLRGTLSLREIGQELCLSQNTIKTHARAIYRKLGVSTRQEAVAKGRDLNIW
jgi:DNA-binding CsgD family transcriptional regulator